MLPGLRPTSLPSGILIHPAIWPQQIWAKNWGTPPLFGEEELGPHLAQYGLGRDLYLPAKWHLDPSSRLATIDMGRILGAVLPFWRGEAGPHVTKCRLV